MGCYQQQQLEALRMFLAKEYDMISLKIDWSLELLCQKLDKISYQAKLDYFKNKLAFQQGQKVRCFA